MTSEHHRSTSGFDRRIFLVGTAAAGLLAACGGNSSDDESADADSTAGSPSDDAETEAASDGDYALIQRYPADALVPGQIRLPFSLNKDAEFIIDGPESLGAQIFDIDGAPVGEQISAVRRDVAPAPYYAFTPQIDTPGIYGIVVEGGPSSGANFQVMEPGTIATPGPGDALPPFDTPTPDAPAGVDPICTRTPMCEFHEITLADALASKQPLAYIVGTPAFCATGSCTPALEAMIELQPEFDGVVFVHAEVYTDTTATTTAPAVQDLNLTFEPTVFLVGTDGIIVERIDGLWDTTELRERLEALTT